MSVISDVFFNLFFPSSYYDSLTPAYSFVWIHETLAKIVDEKIFWDTFVVYWDAYGGGGSRDEPNA